MNNEDKALDELIKSINYLIQNTFRNTTQIYNGVLLQSLGDNLYSVKMNGQTYQMKYYGQGTHNINDIVKVFVPQGNMALSFFI